MLLTCCFRLYRCLGRYDHLSVYYQHEPLSSIQRARTAQQQACKLALAMWALAHQHHLHAIEPQHCNKDYKAQLIQWSSAMSLPPPAAHGYSLITPKEYLQEQAQPQQQTAQTHRKSAHSIARRIHCL
jgi:hypothetical protein